MYLSQAAMLLTRPVPRGDSQESGVLSLEQAEVTVALNLGTGRHKAGLQAKNYRNC